MSQGSTTKLNVLLADDDPDDRFLFEIALKDVGLPVNLFTVNNGQKLMDYLNDENSTRPDLLFLDLNMPLKNGNECLIDIKASGKTENIPVVIYSTSLRPEIADILYLAGAHYFLQKTDLTALESPLRHVLNLFIHDETSRPNRENFVLTSTNTNHGKNLW